MAGPPTPPPTAPSPAGPPPYGPYPPYPPYPYYVPPPQRDNLVVIVVIVVVAFIAVSVVFAAILYVMVSGLLTGPGDGPPLFTVDQTGGNATIFIIVPSGTIAPNGLRFSLAANGSTSPIHDLPPPDGSVVVTLGTYTLQVFWLDGRNDGLLGTGDEFLVAGDLAPLPARTTFEFSLQAADGSYRTSIGWTSD